MNAGSIITGLIAAAVMGVLTDWLLSKRLPQNPRLPHILAGILAIIALSIIAAWPSIQQIITGPRFDYFVRVQSEDTGENIAGAKVTIEVPGRPPLDEITDTNGVAGISIDSSYLGKRGRLLVEATGYEIYRQEIDLIEGVLPDTIRLKPNTNPTPTLPSPPTSTPTDTPTPTNTPPAPEALASKCGGVQKLLPIPSSPADFDRQFGYTVYNTSNSYTTASEGLLRNIVRSLFVDEDGVWIGYGSSPAGNGGVSYISNPVGNNERIWEVCADAKGNAIGQLVNSITKDHQGNLWVATDGDGVWRLQSGNWEKFVYDDNPSNSNLPPQANYTVLVYDNNIWVGTLDGILRYNGLVWDRPPIGDREQVHAITFAGNGDTWIGFVKRGVRRIRSDGSYMGYNAENSGLSSDNVRSIVIDNMDRVWIATSGGGISVFDNNNWIVYRAGPGALPSDNVNVLAKDKHGRIWAGTDKGTSYFDFDTMVWNNYSNLDTFTIGFGKSTRERCSFDDEHVWIGTNGAGLTHGRLPAPSPVISDFEISGIPDRLAPGQIFNPSVTVTLEKGYSLAVGDFLQVTDQGSYTASPLVAVPADVSIEGGKSYTFSFADNPFTAPQTPGHYQSTWRLRQCGRYVGPLITIEFTVGP